jgi:hypothetical protein
MESLSGTGALSILKILAERQAGFAEAIDAEAEELLGEVDVESLAAEVKDVLGCLDVEDVWTGLANPDKDMSSRANRHGKYSMKRPVSDYGDRYAW